MFRGDVYDDKGFTVNDSNDDSFNIACYGTVISKMHFLRHTVAAMGTDALPVPKRQAMLRLLTADYCGHGNSYTRNGHAIRLDFGPSPFHPDPMKPVGLETARSIEAIWRADGTGASCISTPRRIDDMSAKDNISEAEAEFDIIGGVKTDCQTSPVRVIHECTPAQLTNARKGVLGIDDYAISGNLFPPP
jgi:hypothetical protein